MSVVEQVRSSSTDQHRGRGALLVLCAETASGQLMDSSLYGTTVESNGLPNFMQIANKQTKKPRKGEGCAD